MSCAGDTYMMVYCADCGHSRKVLMSCGDRACPECRKREYKRLMAKYRPCMDMLDHKKLVLITLTTRVQEGEKGAETLRQKIFKIKDCWKKLIRRDVFKGHVQGGFYTVEPKISVYYDGWNVHIHALCEIVQGARLHVWRAFNVKKKRWEDKADIISKFGKLTIQLLKDEWFDLTGDSHRVDITPVRIKSKGEGVLKDGAVGALSYILKYLKKAADVGNFVDEYNRAVKGRKARVVDGEIIAPGQTGLRLMDAFGTWYPNSKGYRFANVDMTKPKVFCDACGHEGWLSELEFFRLRKVAYMQGDEVKYRSKVKPIVEEKIIAESRFLQMWLGLIPNVA